MPRYFFDINDHDLSHRDDEGSQWPSRDAARAHAMRILADIARDEARRQDRLNLFVTIRDESCAVLAVASLAVACTWLDGSRRAG